MKYRFIKKINRATYLAFNEHVEMSTDDIESHRWVLECPGSNISRCACGLVRQSYDRKGETYYYNPNKKVEIGPRCPMSPEEHDIMDVIE